MDAVVMNPNKTIQELIVASPAQKGVILVGDANVVCTAQSLWKRGDFAEDMLANMTGLIPCPHLLENGCLSSLLGGCSPASSAAQKEECYRKMDKGWHDKAVAARMAEAD